MQSSNIPPKIVKPFANAASGSYVNTIPVNSQIPTAPGRASLADGFPPLTFQPLDNGGAPPFGADMNGILKSITAIQQWQTAGGGFPYDATFSSTNNGYPSGAVVQSSSGNGYWLSLVDNNTTNPDTTTTTTNWTPYNFVGLNEITVTSPTYTVTNLQAAYPILNFLGALTADTTVILPPWKKQWVLGNSTTGGFKLTAKTATNNGVIIRSGNSVNVFGDGTYILLSDTFEVSFSPTGYQRLPSGLIFQWGKTSIPAALTDIYFPIPFPNAVLSITATDYGVGCNSVSAAPVNNLYFQGAGKNAGSTTYASTAYQWFAIGY